MPNIDQKTRLPTLVFIHGWGSDTGVWQSFLSHLRVLSAHQYLCWDLPGFGQNLSAVTSLDEYLKHAVKQLPNHCILVGWSLGGMLATRLAHMAPDKVVGLVAFAANAAFVGDDDWPHAMSQQLFASFQSQFSQAPEKTFKRFCLLQTKGDAKAKGALGFLKACAPKPEQFAQWAVALGWLGALDNRTLIAEIHQPQLHVFAHNDALVPVAVARDFEQRLNAHCELLPVASHSVLLTHPAETAGLLKSFLQKWRGISKRKIAQSFGAAASTYDSAARIQQVAGKELLCLVDAPLRGTWLDVGSGTDFLKRNLQPGLHPEYWLSGDLSQHMLLNAKSLPAAAAAHRSAWLRLDAEQLPFPSNSLNGVCSSLTLQWVCNLEQTLRQFFDALKPGGECLVATLGGTTLHELKTAWRAVDSYVHVNEFLSAADIAKAFSLAGFEIITCKESTLTDEFEDLVPLLKSLKAIGAQNMNPGQKQGLTTRRQLQQLAAAYEPFRNSLGKLPATYQVQFIRAKKYE